MSAATEHAEHRTATQTGSRDDRPPAQPASAEPATVAPTPGASPVLRSATYIAASALLWLTQGLGMNLVAVNTPQLQGDLGATLTETSWLVAAYMAPNVSLTILLTKIRTQFGLRRFAEISIAVFVMSALLHLTVRDLWSALPVRFLAGAAASPLSTLAFLYMLEAFAPARKLTWGLSLALTCSAATPVIARLISPLLLDIGQWQELYSLELGLALIAFAVVFTLPLTPVPHAKVLHWRDFVTYPLLAVGFGLLAVVLALGRFYWWFEAPWIGVCLALAILCIATAVALEIDRKEPLLHIDWLLSPQILHFTLTLLLFRIALAEQSSGSVGLFQQLGLLNDQSRTLYLIILAVSVGGGLLCGALMKLERVPALHALALLCIAVGAFIDSGATSQTRPENMYLSQALIAFGGALFLPSAMLAGLTATFKRGPTFITSFLAVFLFTQSLGGLVGSALFGSFVTLREKFHSNHLVEHLSLDDPLVVARLRQLGALYGKVLADPVQLQAEGLALLSQQATREAYVLAYNDAFLAIGLIAVAALAALLIHIGWKAFEAGRLARPAAT